MKFITWKMNFLLPNRILGSPFKEHITKSFELNNFELKGILEYMDELASEVNAWIIVILLKKNCFPLDLQKKRA